jgi:tellurite resistance protein
MTDQHRETGEPTPGQPAPLDTWTPQQEADFNVARETLNALVAACSARISSTSDAAQAERFRRHQAHYAAQRRALAVTDDDAVQRILREYPPVLQRLREGGDM